MEKNTTYTEVINSFHSTFQDKVIIPEGLEKVWFLKAVGKYSFEIYLIHGAVISVLFGMAYTYIPHWWHVFTILTFVATFLFAWMLKRVTKVINQRFI